MKKGPLIGLLFAVGFVVALAGLAFYFKARQKSSPVLEEAPVHGASYLLEWDAADGGDGTNAIGQVREVFEKRIRNLGEKMYWEPVSATRARLTIPVMDRDEAEYFKTNILRTGRLELRLVHPETDSLVSQGLGALNYEALKYPHQTREGRDAPAYLLRKKPQLSGNHVKNAVVSRDQAGNPQIYFYLDTEGAKLFATITKENINHQLAIVVDGEILSVPVINTPIEGGTAVITGKFTTEQAMVLANALSAPLPFKVSVVESKIF